MDFLEKFALAFVQLFFAVDAIGVLPMFVSLTEGMDAPTRRKTVRQMVLTALLVGIGFLFFGDRLFGWLRVTVQDFMVAGGCLLFFIATGDLLSGQQLTRKVGTAVGAVPLGTPLIVGPAVLTMELMLLAVCGWGPTLAAVIANVLLAGVLFRASDLVTRLLGKTGTTVASKVASLILAAIAVMMVRRGITGIIEAFPKG